MTYDDLIGNAASAITRFILRYTYLGNGPISSEKNKKITALYIFKLKNVNLHDVKMTNVLYIFYEMHT
jgi:hypothetical protein